MAKRSKRGPNKRRGKPGRRPAKSAAIRTAEEFAQVVQILTDAGMEKERAVGVAADLVLPPSGSH